MRVGRGVRCGVLLVLLAAAIPAAGSPALAAAKKGAAVCASDDPPKFPWNMFTVGATCVEISNSISYVYQNLLKSEGSLPRPTSPGTASSSDPIVRTLTFSPSINTTTAMALGDLKTAFGLSIERSSDDDGVRVTLGNATVELAGVTVGYDSSVMNFWQGDFQFSAAVPSRTVGIVRYEHPVSENAKLGLSLETGVPTTSPPADEFAPLYTDDPVLAVRWLYETDPLTAQVAAMVHELKFDRTNTIIARRASDPDSVFGWAVTGGATVAVPFLGEDDNVSVQVTYAVNASPYLGTSNDLSTLASIVPFNIETRGFSAVASYHRVWSEQWESNAFASYLALDIDTPAANPSVRTVRLAANLIFIPVEGIRLGGELGVLDARLDANGPRGILSGASGKQLTGYLFASVDF